MKKLLSLGATGCLALMLAACNQEVEKVEQNNTNNTKTVEQQNEITNKENTQKEEKVVAKVGETLSINGVNITVTGVKRFNGRINQFQPLTNDHAIQVDVIVENTTKEVVYVDSNEFTLYDTQDFEVPQALPGDVQPLSAEIPPGKKVKGSIFFDVANEQGIRELHYTSMASFSGESAIWELPAE